jgi:hypothetical protein
MTVGRTADAGNGDTTPSRGGVVHTAPIGCRWYFVGPTLTGARACRPAGTPDGAGYDLFAADRGVFAFGDAPFDGSIGGTRLKAPIVGGALATTGGGYWLARPIVGIG